MTERSGLDDELSMSGDSESAKDSETEFEDVDDDDDATNQTTPNWNRTFRPADSGFQGGSSAFRPEFGVTAQSMPFEILQKLITEDMIQEICDVCDRYVAQVKLAKPTKYSRWTDVGVGEMWRFIAINLAMGLVKKQSIKSYWSNKRTLSTPFFGQEMSRNRFEAILSALHLHDKENVPPNSDRFIKMGNFMKRLIQQLQKAIVPGEFLCLDESMLAYKGRLGFKQFNPMKRARFGILFYLLVDCFTGIVLDVLPYQGKATKLPKKLTDELKRGGATVFVMLQPYFNKKHKVVTDNFFNSPTLAHKLLEKKTFLLGTAQKRRKGMPKMTGKLRKGQVNVHSNGKILLERWNDRREVVMMNTFLPHSMTFSVARYPHNSREKPASVLLYNSKMGAVDSIDRMVKPHGCHRKTYKWYKKVFFYFVDLAIYNAWQAWKAHQTGRNGIFSVYGDFVLSIINSILEAFPAERNKKGRPAVHAASKPETVEFHIPMKKGRSDCKWCRVSKKERHQSQIKCTVCDVYLCLQKGEKSCFSEFHEDLQKPKRVQASRDRSPLVDIGNIVSQSMEFSPTITSTSIFNGRPTDSENMDSEPSPSLLS